MLTSITTKKWSIRDLSASRASHSSRSVVKGNSLLKRSLSQRLEGGGGGKGGGRGRVGGGGRGRRKGGREREGRGRREGEEERGEGEGG